MSHKKIKGRGIGDNPSGRYEEYRREIVLEDSWEEHTNEWKTQLHADHSKSIISSNDSL